MSYDILDEIIQTTKSKRYEENNVTIIVEYGKSHTFRIIHRTDPFSYEFLFMKFIFDDDTLITFNFGKKFTDDNILKDFKDDDKIKVLNFMCL